MIAAFRVPLIADVTLACSAAILELSVVCVIEVTVPFAAFTTVFSPSVPYFREVAISPLRVNNVMRSRRKPLFVLSCSPSACNCLRTFAIAALVALPPTLISPDFAVISAI